MKKDDNKLSSKKRVLRVLCVDEKGIINWITGLISKHGGNIIDLEQHAEKDSGLFSMRLEVEGISNDSVLKKELLNQNYKNFQFWLDDADYQQKVAIMVTKEEHCLYELLIKQKTGELNCQIPFIISNRRDLEYIAKDFSIPFYYFSVGSNIREQEIQIDKLLDANNIDLIVLAKYMRILSKNFIKKKYGKIINIHHSFLPAFKGAKPYHRAWERGVKIIGASAHYATEDLDEGPIINQSTIKISHRHSIKEIIRVGVDNERTTLAYAVRAHLEHRIILAGKRTIVFHY